MPRAVRTDFAGTIRGATRTPQGGLRMPAALTRVGVLRYQDAQGNEWGELRHPDEVFSADSLATLRGAPVVDLHPNVPVTAENYKALSVGHVHDDIAVEGERLVTATVTVQDATEVRRIDAEERVELSCGYECDTEDAPGVWNGEPYDKVQRRIVYNHVGLGPRGWGRAGSEVSLRLDGAAIQVRTDGAAPKGNDTVKTIVIKGKTYRVDSPEEMAAAQAAVADVEKKADADTSALDALQKALQDAMGQVAAWKAKAEASAAPPPVTEETVPEAVADSLVAKRIALLTDARKVLGNEWKAERNDGGKVVALTAAEVKRAVVAHALPSMKLDGLTAEVIDGMYRATVAGAAPQNVGLANAHRAAAGADDQGQQRADGEDDPAEASRRATATRWQKPLTRSATAPTGERI